MSRDVRIEATGGTAKIRNPWLVVLFTIITFGIYGWFWWYFINRELVDLGRSRQNTKLGTSAGQSTAAYTLGAFVYIPWIWTIVTTNQRLRRAQEVTVGRTHSTWLAWALWIFTFTLGGMVYTQYELNKVWRAPGMRPMDPAKLDPAALAAGDEARAAKLEELVSAGTLTAEEASRQRTRLGLPQS